MPLLKGKGFKSTPKKAIEYVTDAKKAVLVTSYALDDNLSYNKQFNATAMLYNKAQDYDNRKYYHFKQSFDPKDNITPQLAHQLTEEFVKRAFPNHECVIATHDDKKHIHSHIIVNSVSFEDGKMLNLRNKEYGALKDLSNEIAVENGFSSLEWRKPSKDKVTQAEYHIQLNGGVSWKEELKEVISEAMEKSTNFMEFRNHLEKYGVTIERNTEKTISFKHPEQKKAVRGERLGEEFTKGAILNAIDKQRNRGNITEQSDSTGKIERTERKKQNGAGEQPAERKLDGIQRSVREITDNIKQYTPKGRAELRESESRRQAEIRQLESDRSEFEELQRNIDREHKSRNTKHDKGTER